MTDPDRWATHQCKYYKKRMATPQGRLEAALKGVIKETLVYGRRTRWRKHINWTPDALKAHLESQFKPGMSWDNYGEWHVDHIIPKSWFRYESPEDAEFQQCWCLANLQPLWANENMSKGNRYAG